MTGDELTTRESAVLAAVERRLTNAEIAEEFYISVRTVESHIAALRRKLQADSRSKLITVARARRAAAVHVPQNSFVGRRDDVDAVRSLLDGARWVTVVGAAGCGKTRLALELAAADARVPVVADLEHVAPDEVAAAVASAIGLPGGAGNADLLAACAVALEGRPHLLVIDNCDRVSDSVGQVVGQLLVSARSLTVLATSRSPVGASDETVYQLAPLPVDDTGATRLFLDRARSAAPATVLTDADTTLVAGICERLDGLPLAIELAAARVRHLPVAELAARLEDGFGPLDRAGPASRHRTLETAFDWTWDLLDDDEKSVLCALAALPRTFDLELAEAVTAPGSDGVVLRLLDRSLVCATATDSDPRRFRLLGSLRAFVLDRTAPETVDRVRRTHAAYHAAIAADLSKRARTDDSRTAADKAKRLAPEANAAIQWAIAEQHELAVPLARALAVLVEQYGPDVDSLDVIARAARDPHVRRAATAMDLLDIGLALCYDDLDLVSELGALALEVAGDDEAELAARHLAGHVAAYRHNGRSALAHLDVAERLADERLELWQLASVRQAKGLAFRGGDLNDPDAAIAAFESSMRSYALAGDAMHVNNARYMMASTAAEAGRHTDRAMTWAQQCVEYGHASGHRHELAHAVLTRATLSPESDVDAELFDAVDTFRGRRRPQVPDPQLPAPRRAPPGGRAGAAPSTGSRLRPASP